MSSTALADSQTVVRRIIWIQAITIGWMTVEAIFALAASWRAHSPALLAFGGDSAIELLSAVVVYWRFRSKRSSEQTEQLAARMTGVLLFALAAYVALVAALALAGHREVKPSYLGIVVLIVAAVVMPLLANQKRRLSALTASAALRADAAESALCGYLSIIALGGLVANAFWGISWAYPVAALCLIPLVAFEGWQAFKGRPCDCCWHYPTAVTSMTANDRTDLRDKVRIAYSAAAEMPLEKHAFPVGRAFAESVGYPAELLDQLPAVASDAFAGVSNVSVFAEIPSGATILDLGGGAGLDALIAARRVGPAGKVIAVDFSLAMLARGGKP